MYYRIINWLDHQPHATGYNATSINELVDAVYDLLGDEYFEYDLDFIEWYEHKFNTEKKRKQRLKEQIESWCVGVLDIEKRKYPFKYTDLAHRYGDFAEYKERDKEMAERFKKRATIR